MVAAMACIENYGNRFFFQNIDPKKYESWTRESVRRISDELMNQPEPPAKTPDEIMSPSDPENLDRPYTALVNEECQKRRLPLPNYEFEGETWNGITKFRCLVTDFSTFPDFRSSALPSKRAAKNEAAKCIYHWMTVETKGTKTATQPLEFPSSKELNFSADFVPFENLNNSNDESVINPKIMIPLVMTLLTQVSKACHPDMSPIQGINELIDQWKEFLEWKDGAQLIARNP